MSKTVELHKAFEFHYNSKSTGKPERLIMGYVYKHPKFPDGTPIHTSRLIEYIGNNLLQTKNSLYRVIDWDNSEKNKEYLLAHFPMLSRKSLGA